MREQHGDEITGNVHVTGSAGGQIAIGKGIEQRQAIGAPLTDAEREEVRLAFATLREQVAAGAPEARRDAAVERVGELEQAVFAKQPNLTTVEYVTRWFREHLPALAGAVTGLVLHPLIGRLVQVAGDRLVELVGGSPAA